MCPLYRYCAIKNLDIIFVSLLQADWISISIYPVSMIFSCLIDCSPLHLILLCFPIFRYSAIVYSYSLLLIEVTIYLNLFQFIKARSLTLRTMAHFYPLQQISLGGNEKKQVH